MATVWVPIRISAETDAALRRVRESMARAYENGQITAGPTAKETVPLYQVIDYLVQHYQRHRERRVKSARKRRAEKQQCRDRTTTSSQVAMQASRNSSVPCTLAIAAWSEGNRLPLPLIDSQNGEQHSGAALPEKKAV